MTEDEAKLKRCCGPEDCGQIGNDNDRDRYCIGSACMAWRWTADALALAAQQNRSSYSADELTRMSQGHCGLAGKP